MRVSIEADELSDEKVVGTKRSEIVLSEIGTEAWVRIEVGGKSYDIDYREFWNAASAVCIAQVR